MNDSIDVAAFKLKQRKEYINSYFFEKIVDYSNELVEASFLIENIKPMAPNDLYYNEERSYFFEDFIVAIFDLSNNIVKLTKGELGIIKKYNKIYANHKYLIYLVQRHKTFPLLAELNVRFNPRDLKGVSLNFNHSRYKSINVIKDIYKKLFTGKQIEAICDEYGVKIHYLNNNITVIDKIEFDKAISIHTRIDFINPTETIKTLLI